MEAEETKKATAEMLQCAHLFNLLKKRVSSLKKHSDDKKTTKSQQELEGYYSDLIGSLEKWAEDPDHLFKTFSDWRQWMSDALRREIETDPFLISAFDKAFGRSFSEDQSMGEWIQGLNGEAKRSRTSARIHRRSMGAK